MRGGGDRGSFLEIGCVPDAALKAAIDGMITAGTKVQGTLVKLTSAAYTVTGVSENDVPDGKILNYEKTSGSYKLQIQLWHYKNTLNNEGSANAILNVAYTGTLGIGNAVVAASVAKTVKAGSTSGWGYVIAKDVPSSGYCDVIV